MMGGCFFFEQYTAYELLISDWSSDVCSSDLGSSSSIWLLGASTKQTRTFCAGRSNASPIFSAPSRSRYSATAAGMEGVATPIWLSRPNFIASSALRQPRRAFEHVCAALHHIAIVEAGRSEEHTSELQSLMRISY